MIKHDLQKRLVDQLTDLVNRHYYSHCAYLTECDPWVPENIRGVMRRMLEEIAGEEKQIAQRLGNQILLLGSPVVLGNYTMEITELSYLALGHSIGKAMAEKQHSIARIDKVMSDAAGMTGLIEELTSMRATNQAHIERLEEARRQLN